MNKKRSTTLLIMAVLAATQLAGCTLKAPADNEKNTITGEITTGKIDTGDMNTDAIDTGDVETGDVVTGDAETGITSEDSVTGNITKAEEIPLTQEELSNFTDFFQKQENNGFLCSTYTTPTEVNLNEVFYNGAGITNPEMTESETMDFLAVSGFTETEGDVIYLTTGQINTVLEQKIGYAFSEMTSKLDWIYLEDYDSYYHMAGDTNYVILEAKEGTRKTDGTICVQCVAPDNGVSQSVEACTVTLRETDGQYQFVSNKITSGYAAEE